MKFRTFNLTNFKSKNLISHFIKQIFEGLGFKTSHIHLTKLFSREPKTESVQL